MKRHSYGFVIVVMLLAACGGAGVGDIAAIDTLTETYGCGTGFWVGNSDDTTALRFQHRGDGVPSEVNLPSDEWDVEMLDGRDLYANWCDDVIEADEPQPQVGRRLPVIAGEIEVIGVPPPRFESGTLTLRATNLVLDIGDGKTADLGDIEISNTSWGFLGG